MTSSKKENTSDIAAYFTKIAKDFDSYYDKPSNWFQRLTNRLFRKPVIMKRLALGLQILDQRPKQTILDIGCGSGVLAIPLAQRGHKVVGIDFSAPMIALAKEKAQKIGLSIEFKIADFMADDFGKFDSTIALGVLEYLKDPRNIIQKMISITRPGGFIIFDIPELFNYHTLFRIPYLVWRKRRVFFYPPWAARKLLKPFHVELTELTFHHYGAGYLIVLKKQ